MADKSVGELIEAKSVTPTDLFVLEQNGTAKKLTGQILENWLVSFADGHGGIQSIAKTSTSGLVDTYRITLADTTTFDFVVNNGRSVRSIVKISTSGLVDTYRISYNDNTTDTFAVTNGEKGDKGDNADIWIRYASQKPTAESHSFGELPDSWIGVASGHLASAPTDWQAYTWYQWKGAKGDKGDPATMVSSNVEYQVSPSGTVVPSGSWSYSVPVVPQGMYLWTKITNTFNTGSPVISYSVSRMGLDGSGSVSSVANISPDENGNVPLTAEHVGAVPSTGGDMNGELRMNGQPISGLNLPTANDQAANMGFVNQQVRKAVPRNLLDNSDFRNPVCQRGTSFTTHEGKYTIDRWYATGSVVCSDDGIEFTNLATSGANNLYQYFEPGTIVPGKEYTAACMLADGTLCVGSGTATSGTVRLLTSETIGLQINSGDDKDHFGVRNEVPDQTLRIVWAALYEGEYTKETLPEYQPKGYGVELLECQRYYLVPNNEPLGNGYINGAKTLAYISIPVPIKMRVKPTVVYGSIYVKYEAKQSQSSADPIVYKNNANAVTIQIPGEYELASVNAAAFAYTFNLSADINPKEG